MTIKEIADRLVAHCRNAKWEAAQKELYADDAVSIEPHDGPVFAKETKSLRAIIEKGRKFSALIEMLHSHVVSDPIVADNAFACTMTLDATMQGQGRMKMSELCVYEVRNGKIVSEQFHM